METERALTIGNFTDRHHSISDDFIDRVREMLKDETKKLVTYGITETYEKKESVRFDFAGEFRLEIHLTKN